MIKMFFTLYIYINNIGLKLNSWRATALHSLAPIHTRLEVSSDSEELDYLDQVCLNRVGAKLCRAVALQELSLRPIIHMHYMHGYMQACTHKYAKTNICTHYICLTMMV